MHPATIGPFEIERALGRGGMGEVYLARDTRLDRPVAIKALPAHLADDPDRLVRFQREAKVLASLSHPGIGAIHGLEEANGHQYLILEYVEGETLADRLARGPIPIGESLSLARQIAEALEAAHEKGVIHRDLKPGNMMVTPDGVAKVLDFGLARTTDHAPSSTSAAPADSPTVTSPARNSPTIPGVILGTAGYMSPEQARGRPVDRRSDVFSFGCVLFEMLTGAGPFPGETVTDSLGAILHREPDWSLLPPGVPWRVRDVLAMCLAKDRRDRLRDIGDARLLLAQALDEARGSTMDLEGAAAPRHRGRRAALPWALAGATALVGGSFPFWSGRVGFESGMRQARAPVARFTIEPPTGYTIPDFITQGSSLAVNPAGDRIAYVARTEDKSLLCMHDVASGQSRVLPNTEGTTDAVFSPDGKWLAFVTGHRLLKMPADGGPSLTLCDAPNDGDYAWLDDGTIVWTHGQSGLWRVGKVGGEASLLAPSGPHVQTAGGDMTVLGFDSPMAVPGAEYLLASVWDGNTTESYHLVKVALADGVMHTVLRNVGSPSLVASDRLLFIRDSTIMTVRFDPVRGAVVGEPKVALEGVRNGLWTDSPYIGSSIRGTVAYVPGGRESVGRRLIRVDESGQAVPLLDAPDSYAHSPAVSPDGRRVVFTTLRTKIEVWTLDLERRTKSLVTSQGENYAATWSADGSSIFTQLYRSDRPETPTSIVRWPMGGGDPVPLVDSCPNNDDNEPIRALPDGSGLLVRTTVRKEVARYDLALYSLADATLTPVRDRPANEVDGSVSPDGKWIAYVSDESGRSEVYVGPLGTKELDVQVSTNGGARPRFSRDGARLFFVDRELALVAVAVDTSGSQVRASMPVKLFDLESVGGVVEESATIGAFGGFDVLPSGEFVMIEKAAWEKDPPVIHVILNWPEELDRLDPGPSPRG